MKFRSIDVRLATLAFAAVGAPPVLSQSFNVDVGSLTSPFGVPSSFYGAAAASPGVWNAFSAASTGPMALLDLAGTATGATLSIAGGQGNFQFNNAGTSGDDQALMDDCGDLNLLGGGLDTATYLFTGLANGSYRVFVYAWTPDFPSFTTTVDIAGGIPCPRLCGGAGWSGAHVETVTYVQETVQVSAGTLAITVTSDIGWGSCNGIQLVASAQGQGAVLGVFDMNPPSFAPEAVVESAPIEAVESFNYTWILGDGNGPKLHRCRRVVMGAIKYLQYLQSFDISSYVTDPQGLSAFPDGNRNRIVVWGFQPAMPPVDTTATFNWNASGSVVSHRYSTSSFFKTNTSAFVETVLGSQTYTTFGILNNGDVGKFLRDGNTGALSLQLSWTPPAGLMIVDLAYDPVADVLWAFSRTSPCGGTTNLVEFVPLDPDTGAIVGARFMGDLTLPAPNLAVSCGIAASPLDPNRLALVALHENGTDDKLVYYALGSAPWPSPVSYCTAGTSTNGCVPILSIAANPSLFGMHDATLVATQLEGSKTGLCFYGINGPVALQWGAGSSSFLCVKAPTQRLPPQSSGGTSGQCNGSFVYDLLQFTYTTPTALGQPFLAGTTLYTQGWYRDPPAVKTTNLTDALQLTWQP